MSALPARPIDVVLTCYNEGAYIGMAVKSVLSQTRADLIRSIVIADDGSDEPTRTVLDEIERWDDRIEVIYGAGGTGLPGQRNIAIAKGNAPLIAILDGDDVWDACKLEKQLPQFGEPHVGLVYSGYFKFPDDDPGAARVASVRDISRDRDLTLSYFVRDPRIIPSSVLIRRDMFEACGRFDASIRVFEDSDFYIRLSRFCAFAHVSTPLVYKRARTSSIGAARLELMARHAFVAFKAAADEPRLLPYVPHRLAERARKLGNQMFLLREFDQARYVLRCATRLDPWNARAWISWLIAMYGAKWAHSLIARTLRSRKLALGMK